MFPAFLTTIFFSISVVCAHRSTRVIGGTEANFWRLTFATVFLSTWAMSFGQGLSGTSFPTFLLSGIIGIGFGDVALFQTIPRLGPRLSLLIVQCLTAPLGAAVEWLWLGTKLSPAEMACAAVILLGIGISLAPNKHLNIPRKQLVPGILFGVTAALGGAFGAVLSRKGYAGIEHTGEVLDGATAAYQRLLGGLLIAGICLLVVKWRAVKRELFRANAEPSHVAADRWRRAGPWIVANALAGQTFGVSCYQKAFQTTPTGIVLSIVAMSPLVAMPITRLMEKERIAWPTIVGGVIAVVGVVLLVRSRHP